MKRKGATPLIFINQLGYYISALWLYKYYVCKSFDPIYFFFDAPHTQHTRTGFHSSFNSLVCGEEWVFFNAAQVRGQLAQFNYHLDLCFRLLGVNEHNRV